MTSSIQPGASLNDWIRHAAHRLKASGLFYGHGTDNADDEALELVLAACGLDYSIDESLLEQTASSEQAGIIEDYLQQRMVQRRPTPYITGRAWFFGLPFHVDERVLIPRSPVAELIDNGFYPWLNHEPRRILDLCAGSGCIGIACARAFSSAQVDLAELSADALDVANSNVLLHDLERRVFLHQGDLFTAIGDQRYDLIISNPPYVGSTEMQGLPDEYRHEPVMALETADEGLEIPLRILRTAPDHLTEHGLLVVEVGNSMDVLLRRYPDFPAVWAEFERGGDGVFIISAPELSDWLAQADL